MARRRLFCSHPAHGLGQAKARWGRDSGNMPLGRDHQRGVGLPGPSFAIPNPIAISASCRHTCNAKKRCRKLRIYKGKTSIRWGRAMPRAARELSMAFLPLVSGGSLVDQVACVLRVSPGLTEKALDGVLGVLYLTLDTGHGEG